MEGTLGSATDPAVDGGGATGRARNRLQWKASLPTVALVALAAWYVSRLSEWDQLSATISAVDGAGLTWLAIITALNIVTYWLVLAAALPGLRPRRAGLVQLPSTAISNLVPGGGALGTAFTFVTLRRWGFGADRIAAASLATGVTGTAAKLAAPLTVLVIVVPTGGDADVLMAAAGAAVALALVVGGLVAFLRSNGALIAAARMAARAAAPVSGRSDLAERWPDAAVRFHASLRDLFAERWLLIVGSTVASHVALFVLFVASLRAVGLHHDGIGLVAALTVFAVARLVALVPLTPGGIGMIELTLMASLAAAGGDGDRVVAAVVVYRAATYALPTLLGSIILVGSAIAQRGGATDEAQLVDEDRCEVPLVVDLDGTLLPVTTRTLMMGRLWRQGAGTRREYRRLGRCDRSASKWFLWQRVGLDVRAAPIRPELMRWLDAERRRGREIFIASGAPQPVVEAFVQRCPVFTAGWGSVPGQHLVGAAKQRFLAERFPDSGFDYVGDSREDLAVWEAADRAIIWMAPRRVVRHARSAVPELQIRSRPRLAVARQVWVTVPAVVRQWRTAPAPVASRGTADLGTGGPPSLRVTTRSTPNPGACRERHRESIGTSARRDPA